MFTDRQTDGQPDFLQRLDLSRSSSRARNTNNANFSKNRLSGSGNLRDLCSMTE